MTAPRHRLAPGVHIAAVDEDLVILDTAEDAYLCLAQGADAVRPRAGTDGLDIADAGLAADLVAAGLAITSGPERPRAPPPPRPTVSWMTAAPGPPRRRDLARASGPLLDVARGYRGRDLAQLLAWSAAHGPAVPRADPAALPAAVADFHRWAPYAPVSGKCLVRSFLLLRVLRRAGHDATWVFGVATRPFRAHCWLQAGEAALDDHAERLAAYVPILAV